ncbi:MAG TPA: PA domain-containing protein, partial [Candidatus Polarisedimenticolaceae bacterium]|nr:PA domain-containing protein [Candidatus Polarisedimenticolaceae bacterium]
MKHLHSKTPSFVLTLIVGLICTSNAFGTATIVIENGDAAGTGFNDPTAAAPIGGNPGTTVGQQRLNAFQYAANIWGATLTSGPTVTIHASWASLSCTSSSGVLGSAGNSGSIWRDFTGAVPGTWYGNALANALTNSDLNGAPAEIVAQFNSNLGNPGCLETLHWYYGLDTNTNAGGINMVAVLLHEFGHGLGFQSYTNTASGAQISGFPSIYDRFLLDTTTGKTWPQMTDAEREASAINTNNLVWNGAQVVSDVPSVLGTPRLRVNSPPAIAGNYQVGTADFGPRLTTGGVTAGVVQAVDPSDGAGASTTDACSPLTNAAAVLGKIALIDRGSCSFVVKVKNAQDTGAGGVIIADNIAGGPPAVLGGSDPTITIPSVQITLADGNTIKSQLGTGVNATLLVDGAAPVGADPSGRPRLFTPNPRQAGSSVSHWDTSLFPNQLMEPGINGDLTHSVKPPQDLTVSQMID